MLIFIICLAIAVSISQDMKYEYVLSTIIFIFWIYYFLIVPLLIFPVLFGTSRKRIVGAYFAMNLFTNFFFITLPVFYFVYIPSKQLLRFVRGRREVRINIK